MITDHRETNLVPSELNLPIQDGDDMTDHQDCTSVVDSISYSSRNSCLVKGGNTSRSHRSEAKENTSEGLMMLYPKAKRFKGQANVVYLIDGVRYVGIPVREPRPCFDACKQSVPFTGRSVMRISTREPRMVGTPLSKSLRTIKESSNRTDIWQDPKQAKSD